MQRAEEVSTKNWSLWGDSMKHCFYVKCVNKMQMDPKWRSDVLLCSCSREYSVYIAFISPVIDAATEETNWNKISFSHLPSLLCKVCRQACTAAIRQRMVVFLTAYCTCLLLQPRISCISRSPRSLVGKKQRREWEDREISPPPLFICGWIFCTHSFSKACFCSSEACLKQLAAKEIRTYASSSPSGTEPGISTWPPEVVLRFAHISGQSLLLCD